LPTGDRPLLVSTALPGSLTEPPLSSAETITVSVPKRVSRRRALITAGAVIAVAGAAAALAKAPRRADGLPAGVDLAKARALGDGFFVVDGWVLTAKDFQALKASAPAPLP
jgi:hypothetical protein